MADHIFISRGVKTNTDFFLFFLTYTAYTGQAKILVAGHVNQNVKKKEVPGLTCIAQLLPRSLIANPLVYYIWGIIKSKVDIKNAIVAIIFRDC